MEAINFTAGDFVWFPDDTEGLVLGKITKISNAYDDEVDAKSTQSIESSQIGFHISYMNDNEETKSIKTIFISQYDLLVNTQSNYYKKLQVCGNHRHLDITNMTELQELSDGSILYHMKKRFHNNEVYTNFGSIVVAINPYQLLDVNNYNQIDPLVTMSPELETKLYPHIFATADIALQQLQINKTNQSIIISGSYGSGKTEVSNRIIQFLLTKLSIKQPHNPSQQTIENIAIQSATLLEVFGNAKICYNDNSSRFATWKQVNIDSMTNQIKGLIKIV